MWTTLLLLLAAVSSTFTLSAAQEYCTCQYTVPPEEEVDCRVYGQLGDGNLIPWHRANQTCLDEWKIKVSSIDREALWKMCPYPNETNASVQLLVNEIKFNPSPATRAIQAFYKQFWIESSTTQGSYVFLDSIQDSRDSVIYCTESETLCWGVVKEFFENNPGEVGTACFDFHARQRVNLELEQSTIRIRLCVEGASVACEPLQAQILEYKAANSDRACSAFGLGPGNNAPVCETGTTLAASEEDAGNELPAYDTYICSTEDLSCNGTFLQLSFFECDNETLGNRMGAYNPMRMNISVHWDENSDNKTEIPYVKPDDPAYEFLSVNYATGEVVSDLQRESTVASALSKSPSTSSTTVYVHEGGRTDIFHRYAQAGVYKPVFNICAVHDELVKQRPCKLSCGYYNYEFVNETTIYFNQTIIIDERGDRVQLACDTRPFYIGEDGTCSPDPIPPTMAPTPKTTKAPIPPTAVTTPIPPTTVTAISPTRPSSSSLSKYLSWWMGAVFVSLY